MSRQTSIETYNIIKQSGLLSKRRLQAYDVLFNHGPLTATGIATQVSDFKSPSVGFNIHARLCELREMGCVKELGETVCPHTGMKVILWDVTDRVPLKLPKRKTKDQIIKELQDRISVLEKLVPNGTNSVTIA